jgi:hypothetical protein
MSRLLSRSLTHSLSQIGYTTSTFYDYAYVCLVHMPASCQPPISFFETMECTRYFSTFFSRAASVVHGGVSISPWPLILSAADTHTQRISISWARERMYVYAYTKIPNTRIETSCGKGVDERVSVLMLREGKCRAHQYTRQLGGRNWDNEAPGAHKSAIAHH